MIRLGRSLGYWCRLQIVGSILTGSKYLYELKIIFPDLGFSYLYYKIEIFCTFVSLFKKKMIISTVLGGAEAARFLLITHKDNMYR